jgi:predicted short-subunit dehydrogenase-like oxidoreductase (DUF2520 family)
METVNIIGCGRAAGSLAKLWLQSGRFMPGGIANRSMQSSEAAVARIGSGVAVRSVREMPHSRFWLIGTSDHQIVPAAETLAGCGAQLQGGLVFHLAGRFGVEVLAPLAGSGAQLAALHPVRSLTHEHLELEDFAGTACVAEGNEAALEMLRPLVFAIRGSWLPVNEIDRGLYHAAVAMTSNVTKAVTWKAQRWLIRAGLPEETAVTVTNELLNSTVEDLFRSGARQSITGPVVRGDTRTIEAHLEAVRSTHPGDLDIYRILARTVFDLALNRGDLDEATQKRFRDLLQDD